MKGIQFYTDEQLKRLKNLEEAERQYLKTLPYDSGLSVKQSSGKYFDFGGVMSGINSVSKSVLNDSLDTTYEDLKRQKEYNNRSVLSGVSDNDALLMAMDNLQWGQKYTGKDFRSESVWDDVSDTIMGGIAGASATNSPWGFLAAVPVAGRRIVDRIRAGKEARKGNEDLSDFNTGVYNKLSQVADKVDTINDRRLLEAFYNSAAFGGELSTHGADWDNGLTQINSGGTHESNPNGGVPAGVDEEGNPNLVEEGEVIWNNEYVFSDRLKVPKALRDKYKLRQPMTYAEAIKKVTAESDERKNDPISNATTKAIVNEFIDSQEEVRAKKQQRAAAKLQQAQFENELAMALEGLGAEQPLAPMEMQAPAQGVPQEAPVIEQMGAYGGNLFADGGNLFFDGGYEAIRKRKTGRFDRNLQPIYEYIDSTGVVHSTLYDAKKAQDKIDLSKATTRRAVPGMGHIFVDSEGNQHLSKAEAKKAQKEINKGTTQTGTAGTPIENDAVQTEVPTENPEIEASVVTATRNTPPKPEGRTTQSGQIPYNKNMTAAQVKEFESQADYRNFLNMVRDNPEMSAQWIERLNNGDFGNLNGYKIKDMDDWYRLATDGKLGPVHSATLEAANAWRAAESPQTKSNTGREPLLPSMTNSLDSALAEYNSQLASGRTSLNSPGTAPDVEDNTNRAFDWRREAPIIGAAAQSLFGLLGSPDYSEADAIIGAARKLGSPISIPVETIGDYVQRRPFDERYPVNMANQNRAAASRSAANTAGGNRAMQLGADAFLTHSNQQELGEIMRQAYLANRQDEFSTAEFNRGTNLQNMSAINSRNLAQAQLNTHREQAGFSGLASGLNTRLNQRMNWDATTGQNLSNLFNNLSIRGKEASMDNTIQSMVDEGYFTYGYNPDGTLYYSPTDKLKIALGNYKRGGNLKKKRRF